MLPGSIDTTIKLDTTKASFTEITLFVRALLDHIRRWLGKKPWLSPPRKNYDSSYYEAVGYFLEYTKSESEPRLLSAKEIEQRFHFEFLDEYGRKHLFKISPHCSVDYEVA